MLLEYVKLIHLVLVMVHSQRNYLMKSEDQIREVGREYGTTTGRPRRVGWFDSVVVRHARRVSGITDLIC